MSSGTASSGEAKASDLLRVATIRRILICIVIFFCLAGLCSELSKYAFLGYRHDFAKAFSPSYEMEDNNVPTWYAGCQLFVCGAVLAAISMVQRRRGARHVGYWWGLSFMFFYISMDEMLSFHEHAGKLVKAGGGVLYFDWIIPAAVVVGIIGVIYLRFLKHLPRRTRNQFVVAGVIYVGGALCMELPLGSWTDLYGRRTLGYGLIDLVEETMEMLGASLFLVALVEFLLERLRGGEGLEGQGEGGTPGLEG